MRRPSSYLLRRYSCFRFFPTALSYYCVSEQLLHTIFPLLMPSNVTFPLFFATVVGLNILPNGLTERLTEEPWLPNCSPQSI